MKKGAEIQKRAVYFYHLI